MSLDDLRNMKHASMTDWIDQEAPRRTIKREFKDFLLTYVDEHGTSVYGERIKDMGESKWCNAAMCGLRMNHGLPFVCFLLLLGNRESLEISYEHLSQSKTILAYFLANTPLNMLKLFDQVALEVTLIQFPEYERIHRDIHIRITDLPTVNTLRELRQIQLNCLVRVSGVVTRRTGVFPQLKWVKYNCGRCDQLLGPFYQDIHNEIKLQVCPHCGGKGPFNLNAQQVECCFQDGWAPMTFWISD